MGHELTHAFDDQGKNLNLYFQSDLNLTKTNNICIQRQGV